MRRKKKNRRDGRRNEKGGNRGESEEERKIEYQRGDGVKREDERMKMTRKRR
jgi:hypothetical protein